MLRVALLASTALLAACTTLSNLSGGLTQWEQDQLQRREARLAATPDRIRDEPLEHYLVELLGRIDPLAANLRVYLLDHPTPQAEIVGARLLIIRRGLLRALGNEDELAFVLAHEWAHYELDHIRARRNPRWDAATAERLADARAIAHVHRLGYRVLAGVELLERLSPALPDSEQASVADRIRALRSLNLASEPIAEKRSTDHFDRLMAPHRAPARTR